jgi:hypothetical protein
VNNLNRLFGWCGIIYTIQLKLKKVAFLPPFILYLFIYIQYNQNAGNRNHLVQTNKTVELHSDYMAGKTQNWLNECVESPRHWVGEDSYTMETASYINEDDRFEDLIAYTVDGDDFELTSDEREQAEDILTHKFLNQ